MIRSIEERRQPAAAAVAIHHQDYTADDMKKRGMWVRNAIGKIWV